MRPYTDRNGDRYLMFMEVMIQGENPTKGVLYMSADGGDYLVMEAVEFYKRFKKEKVAPNQGGPVTSKN